MPDDPRPGVEEVERPGGPWVTSGDLVFGIVAGLVLAAALAAALPDLRTHLLGGTDRRETTVVDVRIGTRTDGSDRPLTTYDLQWREAGEVRSATHRRSGPPRHEVGETWTLWVSPDGSAVEEESPLVTWAWLGGGLPAICVLLGLLWRWRERVMQRLLHRDVERWAARRRRRRAS